MKTLQHLKKTKIDPILKNEIFEFLIIGIVILQIILLLSK